MHLSARLGLCLSFSLLCAQSAWAGPASPAGEEEVDAYFAKMMSTALDQKIDAGALSEGVPQGLVALIKRRYPQANSQKPLLTEYQGCAAAFEERWAEYSERRAVVDKAIEQAHELKKGKKLDEALAALDGVVTPADPPPTDHLGRAKPVKRSFIEVRDAELPAVTAAAGLVVELRQLERLPQVRADFLARRRVSSSEMTERLGWVAKHCGKNERKSMGRFNGFAAGQKGEALKAVQKVLGYTQQASTGGTSMSKGFFRTMPDYGVKVVSVGSKADVKKGQWVLMQLEPTKASKKKISYKKKDRWTESFNCQPTERIIGIDPVTGKFLYKWKCETRTKQSTVKLTAKLAKKTKLEKNARGKYEKVWLLGQLKKPGPSWSLKNARVIELEEPTDLKFLKPGFN